VNPYWIRNDNNARLAIVPRPRGGDWLGDEIQALRRAGIDVLISALTPEESEELNLQCEEKECENAGIYFVSHCIPDRGLPPSNQTFKEMLERVHVALIQGKAVGIHCRAGIGRSSLISACLLCSFGMTAEQAFRHITESRGCQVPDTPEQKQWVERFTANSQSTPY
jgi:protein-tyrosine phosphatase